MRRSDLRRRESAKSKHTHTHTQSHKHTDTHEKRVRGHETVDKEIFPDALSRPEIEAMRAWAKNLRRRSHEPKTLLGTSPEQRNRSMPSSVRGIEASAGLRFPPLWETSGVSLVPVRLRLESWRETSGEH